MPVVETLRAPRAADVLVAVLGAAVGIGVLFLFPDLVTELPDAAPAVPAVAAIGEAAWWTAVGCLLVQGVFLVWARHARKTAVLGVSAAAGLFAATLPGTVLDVTAPAIILVVFCAFLAAPSRGLWWAFTVAALLNLAGNFINAIGAEGADPLAAFGESFVQVGGLFGIPLLLAVVLRARRESRDAQRRELRALTRERDALVDAKVARERATMARELHDIAAHHMSGIALMASAVERQVSTDPDAARASAKAIRAESTAVLQNLRRVVGLLREDGTGERSVESFATVPELVQSAGAGRSSDVRLEILPLDGERALGDGVGPLAQLAAFRAIQEALANAAMHAPGADCIVEIDDTQPAEVRVLVRNAPPAQPNPARASGAGGFGLVGMRERAELVGADLSYGRTGDGGWEVHLVIPREGTS